MAMNLLLIRHGEAGKRLVDDAPGGADDQRHLTERGRRRMRRGMKGLRKVVRSIDVLVHSPLPRAVESAVIVGQVFGIKVKVLADLAPDTGSRARLVQWITKQREDATLALVGHEPSLSELAAALTTGGDAYCELKKGGACLVRRSGDAGTLVWLLTGRQLRACR